MRARYRSTCPTCHKAIVPGDDIEQRNIHERYSHVQCPVDIGTYEVKIEPGSIASAWSEPPEIPEELFTLKDSEIMMHQFYDKSPWLNMLDKQDKMNQLYGKAVTIPMKAQSSSDRERRIEELREEADRLERDERRRRKQAKRNAKAAKVERRRIEVAKATLESIAADKKARKEDRVEAARVLLGREF